MGPTSQEKLDGLAHTPDWFSLGKKQERTIASLAYNV
jgi:hypothetical protein